jgi:hypothetical protein
MLAAGLATLLLAQVAIAQPPDSSGPVSRYTDVFATAYFDANDGLLALGGPPPEEGCFGLGFDDPAQFMEVQTPAGPIVAVVHQATLPVFVYDITAGDPCEIVFGGGTPVPLYEGTIRTSWTDNDVDASLTRTKSFGGSSTGWVFDGEGNRCHFAAHVRLMITRQDEFRLASEGITITC